LAGLSGNKKISKWNLIESIFFALLVLIAGYALLQSPFFNVKKILVQGNRYLNQEKIKSVSGIKTGVNIFKLNLDPAASNLKLIPMIKEVQVVRSLPATVVIKVKERSPLGLLPAGGSFIEIDEEGVCLMKASAGIPGLPVITGLHYDIPDPGQVVRAEWLENALAVISGLPEEVVAGLSEVHVGEDGRVTVYTMEGVQCRLGQAVKIKTKGEVLAGILLELSKQDAGVEYIDLSCAGQPVVYYENNTGAI